MCLLNFVCVIISGWSPCCAPGPVVLWVVVVPIDVSVSSMAVSVLAGFAGSVVGGVGGIFS